MNHVISFRRPEHLHTVTKLSVPLGEDVSAYVSRLRNLGYKIVEVSPPLDFQGPPQNPKAPAPERKAIDEAKASLPTGATTLPR